MKYWIYLLAWDVLQFTYCCIVAFFLSIMKSVLPAERIKVQLWARSVIVLFCNRHVFFSKLHLAMGYCKITNAPSSSMELTPLSSSLKHTLSLHTRHSRGMKHIYRDIFIPATGEQVNLFYKGRNTSFNIGSQINVVIPPTLSVLFSSFACLTHFKDSFHQHMAGSFLFPRCHIPVPLVSVSPNYIEQGIAQLFSFT